MKKPETYRSGWYGLISFRRSECQQGVAGLFDSAGNCALLFGGKSSVFTGQYFPGVRYITNHQLWVGERKILGGETLLVFFGGAHDVLEGKKIKCRLRLSTRILDANGWLTGDRLRTFMARSGAVAQLDRAVPS
jgi:hypothetical protein